MTSSLKKIVKETDWIFLIFLLVFLNQSNFSLKTVGILLIYVARPNFKFGLLKGRIPKFYLFIIALALINLIFNVRDFSYRYLAAFGMASLLWTYSFLAYHQLKLSVEKYAEKSYNTLKVFTFLNFVFSIAQLIHLMVVTKTFNPYRGLDFPYGLSSGDNIYGIFLQNSYYNVMVSAMLAIYFLYKRNFAFCLLAVTPLMLVFANTGTIIFIVALVLVFATGLIASGLKKYNAAQSLSVWIENLKPPSNYHIRIPAILLFIGLLSFIISPENITYTVKSFVSKIHQGISKEEKKQLYDLEQKSIAFNNTTVTASDDTANKEEELANTDTVKTPVAKPQQYKQFIVDKVSVTNQYIHNFKGKKLSLIETFQYLNSSPRKFLFGAGPVRFSSLTAQKMSGYDSSRIFKRILPHFSTREYEENHKMLIKARAENTPEFWSSINWPDCLYNQLLGEYGVLGFLLFIVFYVFYFLKRIRFWSYGLWVSIMLIPFSFFSYMFEPFAVIIIFEFLMEIDIREGMEKQNLIV